MWPRAIAGSATSAPRASRIATLRRLRVLLIESLCPMSPVACSYPKLCSARVYPARCGRVAVRITLPGGDAFARGHLPRTGAAGVPAEGVALGDRGGHPGAGGAPGAGRRGDLARRGGCRRDGGDLSVRRVGDPRLPAARETAADPGQEGRDDGRAGPPR